MLCLTVLENVVFDEHTREVDYSEKSVTGNIQLLWHVLSFLSSSFFIKLVLDQTSMI